jgi:hypothetical protein
MTQEPVDVMTGRLVALGLITEWSATLEETLRKAFCALTGTKFAAVVAGGQPASWLIGQCKALAAVRKDLPPPARKAIREALESCEQATRRRNDLVHGIKVDHRQPSGALQTQRSRRHTYVPAVQSWTLAEIQEAATDIADAGFELVAAITTALGHETWWTDNQLWLDHHID